LFTKLFINPPLENNTNCVTAVVTAIYAVASDGGSDGTSQYRRLKNISLWRR